MKTVFATDDNKATLVCPKCWKMKTVDVTTLLKDDGPVRIKYTFRCDKCECGSGECADCRVEICHYDNSNIIWLDRRQSFRKNVRIPGKVILPDKNREGSIIILDISLSGIRFETDAEQNIYPGDWLILEFHLDDDHHTFIRKEMAAIRAKHGDIGASYISTDTENPTDRAIGNFLYPKQ